MESKKRLNRSKILLGTYCFAPYCHDDEHVKQLADAGIDFVAASGNSPNLLDLYEKYGIGAFVGMGNVCRSWRGGDRPIGGPQPTPDYTIDDFRKNAAKAADHPAILGYEIVDEPYTYDFDFYNAEMKALEDLFPAQTPYINLFPNYANSDQLGSPTYREHIAEFVKHVDCDYICYDHYIYGERYARLPYAYDNLAAVADACRKSGRDLWIVIQANSNQGDVWLSADKIKLQVYLALVFGAKSINYACWTAGWWHNQIVDRDGIPTEQYDKVKRINADINALSPVYMQYKNLAECIIGDTDGKVSEKYLAGMDVTMDQDNVRDLACNDGTSVAAGYFEKDGGCAIMLANITDPDFTKSDVSTEVTFSVSKSDAKVTAYVRGIPHVLEAVDGIYTIKMNNADGIFVTVE